MSETYYRVQDAADQLCRYGGQPYDDKFCDLLDHLARLNDDIAHLRALPLVEERVTTAKRLLDEIVENYKSVL